MRQSYGAFTTNSTKNREKLLKLSHMAFMLYLGMASTERRKTGDLSTYDLVREELYQQNYTDIARFRKERNSKGRYFPQEIDIHNEQQNSVNYAYYILKRPYKEIFDKYLPTK